MEIQNIPENAYVDLFATSAETVKKPGFEGSTDINEVNILKNPEKEKEEPELDENGQPKQTAATTEEVELDENGQPKVKEVDILETNKPGRKPKYNFSDMSGYFEDRIKNKKFVAIEEEDEKGEKKLFIPKSPEEFDEVFDMQVNYKLEQARKENDQKWYESKSPAWRAVAKYAEMVDDPAEILPFIQGIQSIESVSKINEEEIDGAERIVRIRLRQKGDSEDIIEEQIEALKTTDKLISTAKKVKPVILEEENRQLMYMAQEKKQEEQEYHKMVHDIREKSISAIEAPIFGKQKLKQDEKALIFDLIAQPDEQSQGYGIYSAIDNLYQTGDFDTLKQIALLVAKKDAFLSYVSNLSAQKTAESLQTKLRISGEGKGSASSMLNDDDEEPIVIQRHQYGKVRFGK